MKTMPHLALFLAAAALTAGSGRAGSRPHDSVKLQDHEFARQAVLRGEVLPLPAILARVARYQPGDVIEIELKAHEQLLIYDVDVLIPSGEVHALAVDARSGMLLANRAKRR
jgi:uncharacterized membrane protein YkoI